MAKVLSPVLPAQANGELELLVELTSAQPA
jgi:hypothetical protein